MPILKCSSLYTPAEKDGPINSNKNSTDISTWLQLHTSSSSQLSRHFFSKRENKTNSSSISMRMGTQKSFKLRKPLLICNPLLKLWNLSWKKHQKKPLSKWSKSRFKRKKLILSWVKYQEKKELFFRPSTKPIKSNKIVRNNSPLPFPSWRPLKMLYLCLIKAVFLRWKPWPTRLLQFDWPSRPCVWSSTQRQKKG